MKVISHLASLEGNQLCLILVFICIMLSLASTVMSHFALTQMQKLEKGVLQAQKLLFHQQSWNNIDCNKGARISEDEKKTFEEFDPELEKIKMQIIWRLEKLYPYLLARTVKRGNNLPSKIASLSN